MSALEQTLLKNPEVKEALEKAQSAITEPNGNAADLLQRTQLKVMTLCTEADRKIIGEATDNLRELSVMTDIRYYVEKYETLGKEDSMQVVYGQTAFKMLKEYAELLSKEFVGDMRARMLMPEAA